MTAVSPLTSLRLVPAHRRTEIEPIWRRLEQRTGECPMACSWDWTATWLDHYGDIVPHRFAIGERAGEPRAIALVTESIRPAPAWGRPRTLRLGTAGEPRADTVWVERNGLLTAEGELETFAAALMGALEARGGWERLEIDGFLPGHAEALRTADPRLVIDPKQTPVAELAAGTDVIERMSSGARRRIRQTLNRFGQLELEWASDAHRARAILDELAALHELRHGAEGGAGAFASPRFTAFHHDLIGRLANRAAVVRISRGEETVGCLYGLIENRRMLFYQSGLHRYEDNKLRAGVAAHVLFMRACADRGLTTYDFLAPPDRYKRELATGADELAWGWLDRGTPRGRLLAGARQLRAAARSGNASVRNRSSESRETTSSIPR